MELEINELLRTHFTYLYINIPTEVIKGFLFVLLSGVIGLFAFYGWKHGRRKMVWLLFVEYVIFIYCSTVFLRKVKEGVGYNFKPFWSYEAVRNGQDILIAQNIMNVVVFVPVGILLGILMQKTLKSPKVWLITLGTGLCVSITIEVLQFVFRRGFSEFDDVMHNTLGCLIGLMIVAVIKGIWQFCSRFLYHSVDALDTRYQM